MEVVMGGRRRGAGFLLGAIVGAAGTAAYFFWRGEKNPPAAPGGFVQSRAQEQASAFSTTHASELTRVRSELQAAQASLAERTTELAGLRATVQTTPVEDAWQMRLPAFTALGKQMAIMPASKALAADRAVAAQHLPRIIAAPQDLASVNGIGAIYEQRLYAAGVGSFWELANMGDEDFARLLDLTDLQRAAFDGASIRTQAERLAAETGTVGQLWDGVAPDDLEPIKGIGKVFEQRLYDAGIRTYARLAAATSEELATICGGNMPVKPDYASWIEQAQTLLMERPESLEP
jgi:predicted flap endonuclease-1-like 5' DNA nuclease